MKAIDHATDTIIAEPKLEPNVKVMPMRSSAHFKKVSFSQFIKDWQKIFPEDEGYVDYIANIYNHIKLPERSTKCSAGYDFFLPVGITFSEQSEILIPTGICCRDMQPNEVLLVFARSGLGTKHHIVLANGTAVIDSDYADSDNEGHIFIKLINYGYDDVELEDGKAFCQGIITNFNLTRNDVVNNKRNGGLGSTD